MNSIPINTASLQIWPVQPDMGFRLSHFVEVYPGKKIKAAAAATKVWAAFPSTKDHLLTRGHFSYPMQSPDSTEGLANVEYGDGQIFAL